MNAESIVDGARFEDGGRAAIAWLVEHASPADDICADAAGAATDGDPFRRDGEKVIITLAGSTTTHVVDYGPAPEYKIVRWAVVLGDK